jgi:hypothetical protein
MSSIPIIFHHHSTILPPPIDVCSNKAIASAIRCATEPDYCPSPMDLSPTSSKRHVMVYHQQEQLPDYSMHTMRDQMQSALAVTDVPDVHVHIHQPHHSKDLILRTAQQPHTWLSLLLSVITFRSLLVHDIGCLFLIAFQRVDRLCESVRPMSPIDFDEPLVDQLELACVDNPYHRQVEIVTIHCRHGVTRYFCLGVTGEDEECFLTQIPDMDALARQVDPAIRQQTTATLDDGSLFVFARWKDLGDRTPLPDCAAVHHSLSFFQANCCTQCRQEYVVRPRSIDVNDIVKDVVKDVVAVSTSASAGDDDEDTATTDSIDCSSDYSCCSSSDASDASDASEASEASGMFD